MATGRLISKSIATDERLANLSVEAEYLYLKTVPHLDRDGLIDGRPRYIWATVAPFRTEFIDRCGTLIQEWIDVGLVLRYDGARTPVLWFTGFAKNQGNMRYDREAPSIYPPPPGYIRNDAGLTPAECRTDSGECLEDSRQNPHQDQDQHQDQHQDQFDDDEGGALSENVGIEDLRAIALDLSSRVRGWSGQKRFVKELDQDKLLALVSWLWLYVGLHHEDIYVKDAALARYAKGDPFDKVSNPVGKIIAQARSGNMAPLHPADRAELLEYFQELQQDAAAEPARRHHQPGGT